MTFCRCGLAMYAVGTDTNYIYACADCDPHVIELTEETT